ncbi:MAG: hypothetical protein KC457_36365, partial [Myxococcales bacterium]|nr:hypothetical protein [Myxococcales bacterium]
MTLAREPDAKRRGITLLLAYSIAMHWTRSIGICYDGVDSAFEVALEEGDLEYATYASLHRVGIMSLMGRPQDVVRTSALEAARFARNTGMLEFAEALAVRTKMSEILEGTEVPDDIDLGKFEILTPRCIAASWAMQPLIFLGEGERALAHAEVVSAKAEEGLFGFYLHPEFVFYHGLAAAIALDHAREDRIGPLRKI